MLTKFCMALMFSAILMGGYLQQQYLDRPSRLRANEIGLSTNAAPRTKDRLPANQRTEHFQSSRANISVPVELETGDYILVVGCLHGNFRKNNFTIEITKESETRKPTSGGTVLTPICVLSGPKDGISKSEQLSLSQPSGHPPLNYTFYEAATNQQRRPFSIFTGVGSFHNPKNYSPVQARLLAESKHLRIWFDEADTVSDNDSLSIERLKSLTLKTATTFEKIIVAQLQPWLGEVSDLDRDGKFSILFSSKLSQLQDNRVVLEGLTWSGDYRRELAPPFGNRADLVYLNPQTPNLDLISTVLVHEYVHALGFDLRLQGLQLQSQEQLEEDWLNEALAHVVETKLGNTKANIGYRVNDYRLKTETYPLVVPSYYRAKLWRTHGCRGAAFSFLNWCVSQQGEALVPQLLHSTHRGINNIERGMQQPFTQLFRQWSISQALEIESRQLTRLKLDTTYSWSQAATSVRYFVMNAQNAERYRVSLKNESESGVQLALLPLPDSKAEEASNIVVARSRER